MKLSIKNIGKISDAKIMFEGITVIGGDNSTGKTTIGKTLFAMYKSFDDIDNTIEKELKKYIEKIIKNCFPDIKIDFRVKSILIWNPVIDIDKLLHTYASDEEYIKGYIRECISHSTIQYKIPEERLKKCSQMIRDAVGGDKYRYVEFNAQEIFEEIFDSQIMNVNMKSTDISEVNFTDGKHKISIRISSGGLSLYFEGGIWNNRNVVFIDNPFVVDMMDGKKSGNNAMESDLLMKLRKADKRRGSNLIERSINNDKLKNVSEIISKATGGDIVVQNGKHVLRDSNLSKPINLKNLSAGLKSFSILQMLLQDGRIKDGDILVLDEPEIHLHPQWQMLYAEAIVLLQRDFGINVLITSHSAAFIRAIESYCGIYDRMDVLNIYATRKDETTQTGYTFENLSYSQYGVVDLYGDLTNVFDELDEKLSEKYGDMYD
ncbi:MAG: hypothetical protein E7510_01740 [Ruminococcus sp.]|nr:hypothetical protein [Ruminococcus sp.]